MFPIVSDRQELFAWLDDYATARKEELDRKKLEKDFGLPKAYLLETSPNGDAAKALQALPWHSELIDEDLHFLFDSGKDPFGVLEQLTERHFALYTLQKTSPFEGTLRRAVLETPWVDFAWFAGLVLDILWWDYVLPLHPYRFTKLTFEHEARFERTGRLDDWEEAVGEEDEFGEVGLEDEEASIPLEHRASSLAITEQAQRIKTFLPKLQETHTPFRALRTLRLPAAERGGYELWSWGKMTFRAPSFTEGRANLLTITHLYHLATRRLEDQAWIQAEPLPLGPQGEGHRLKGVPVTLRFSEPLSQAVFAQFVRSVFGRALNLFRLWGNPIWRGETYAYVHAVDLHLWKPLGLELMPSHFRVLLPQGTCGNTVHRLVQNVQHYLDPAVQVFVGETDYKEIFRQALNDLPSRGEA